MFSFYFLLRVLFFCFLEFQSSAFFNRQDQSRYRDQKSWQMDQTYFIVKFVLLERLVETSSKDYPELDLKQEAVLSWPNL